LRASLFVLLLPCLFSSPTLVFAKPNFGDVSGSTQPIGSPFYRHTAFDFDIDLKELVKFEKKGFGRSEIISLILLSKISGAPLKEYGKRRLKMESTLKNLTLEAGLDYVTLYKLVLVLKESIESKGETNLPAPVFKDKKKEKKK